MVVPEVAVVSGEPVDSDAGVVVAVGAEELEEVVQLAATKGRLKPINPERTVLRFIRIAVNISSG